MLCSNCKKENAVFFLKQNINGKETSVALCKSCSKSMVTQGGNFSFFEPFFKSDASSLSADSAKVCNLCGLSFNDIKKLGKVGCPECYNTFKDELSGIIRQIHGNARHCGSTPVNAVDYSKPISKENTLKAQLELAISEERYEDAARLRDEIKSMKGEENE